MYSVRNLNGVPPPVSTMEQKVWYAWVYPFLGRHLTPAVQDGGRAAPKSCAVVVLVLVVVFVNMPVLNEVVVLVIDDVLAVVIVDEDGLVDVDVVNGDDDKVNDIVGGMVAAIDVLVDCALVVIATEADVDVLIWVLMLVVVVVVGLVAEVAVVVAALELLPETVYVVEVDEDTAVFEVSEHVSLENSCRK